MNIVAVSLEALHTHTPTHPPPHTHTLCSLEDKTSIFTYALLNVYARDG